MRPMSHLVYVKQTNPCPNFKQKHVDPRTILYRKKTFGNSKRKALWYIWHNAWIDSEKFVGKRGVSITQAEICGLFQASNIEPDVAKYRIVPKNQCMQLTVENATIVSLDSRKAFMVMWKLAKSNDSEVSTTASEWLLHLQQDSSVVS